MASVVTATDIFCGAGGSSQGAELAGVELKMAANHWPLAIDTHQANFPHVDHDCADVSQVDPRRYPKTTVLWASPECTTFTTASGKQVYYGKPTLFGDLNEESPSTKRSRATMWDVVRFSEYHHYKVVLVENVVQARKWRLFPAWLSAMEALDYKWHICYENSMFHGTPQSRDRMYVTFWKKDLPDPDLDFKVQAECEMCGTTLGIQSWKKPDYRWGKYKRQYVYVCEKCGKEVMPYYTPAYTAIDWSVIGTRIGDRDRPLAPKTMDRIRRGLEKYKNHCLVIKTTHSGNDGHYKSVGDPLPTQASRQSMALIVSTNYWRKNASHVFDALPTQTTGAQHALVVHMRRAGAVTTTADPLGTITAGGRHHALLQAPFLAVHYTPGHCKSIADSFATITASGDHHSLIIPKPFVDAYYGSDSSTPIDRALGTVTPIARHALVVPESVRVEDCYFRMLDIPEIAAGMGFRPGYILLGTKREKTKQCGQAVTPGVADDLYGRATAIL